MDNRLDFFNVLNNYVNTLTDNDSLIVISNNTKTGDSIMCSYGDWEKISILFSEGYTKTEDYNIDTFLTIKELIINTSYNICLQNIDIRNKILNGLIECPILYSNKNGEILCPYCGCIHKHGIKGGDGHRLTHCEDKNNNKECTYNGKKYLRKDGYYIFFNK